MPLKKNSGNENYCNRCGICCVSMIIPGFPKDVYTNDTKPSNTICRYLEIEDDKTSCGLYNSPERPESCIMYLPCELPEERWKGFIGPKERMESIFLNCISRIPLGKEEENAFRFYYSMWKKGHFRDFSFRHLPKDRSSLGTLVSMTEDFIYNHFKREDLPSDIKDIVSDPEWYNFWGVREVLSELMDTCLPMELYKDSKKHPRLRAVLLEWHLFNEIEKTSKFSSEKTKLATVLTDCK